MTESYENRKKSDNIVFSSHFMLNLPIKMNSIHLLNITLRTFIEEHVTILQTTVTIR